MPKKQSLNLLFIGNSHTYYNDMPLLVKRRADDEGYSCRVTMLAHPGWFLEQHANDPEARFNILYGGYDYIILQEHAHPFGPEEGFLTAARSLNTWIHEAGAVPVIYETWAMRDEPHLQSEMNEVHRRVAAEIDALLAPVGEDWWGYMKSWPDLELYDADGAHASRAGSDFAAKLIWEEIRHDMQRKKFVKEHNLWFSLLRHPEQAQYWSPDYLTTASKILLTAGFASGMGKSGKTWFISSPTIS